MILQTLTVITLSIAIAFAGMSTGYAIGHQPEPTIRTADGAVWARSDLRAYVEGRLADANGRIYCEGLAQDPVQDPFIIEGCKARLAQNW